MPRRITKPTGHDRFDLKGQMLRYQRQTVTTTRYADGTVEVVREWLTEREWQR